MPESLFGAVQEAQASVSRLKAEQAVLAETRSNCQAQLDGDNAADVSGASIAAAGGGGNDPITRLQDKVGVTR